MACVLNKKLPIRIFFFFFPNSFGSFPPTREKKRNLLIVFTTTILSLSFQSKDANTPDCDVITFVTRQEAKTKKLNHDNVTPPQSILFLFMPVYFPPKQSTLQNNKKTQTHQHLIVLSSIVEFERNFDLLSVNFSWSWGGEIKFVELCPPHPLWVCVCHLFLFFCFFQINSF